MARRTLTTLLVLGIVVAGSVPIPVAAQTPQPVLLNQESEKLGTVTLDQTTYTVYRYDNLLQYASGVSVYAGGERVTDEATVREVLGALAEKKAAASIGEAEIQKLRAVETRANRSGEVAAATADELEATLDYIRQEDVDVGEERLGELNDTLHNLRAYREEAAAVRSNATRLLSLVERRDSVPNRQLYRQYDATLRAVDALESRGSELSFGLPDNEEALEQLAAGAEDPTTTERFRETARSLGTAANATDLGETIDTSELDHVRAAASERRSEWLSAWQERRNAATEVYATVLAVPVALGVVGYLGWRRVG